MKHMSKVINGRIRPHHRNGLVLIIVVLLAGLTRRLWRRRWRSNQWRCLAPIPIGFYGGEMAAVAPMAAPDMAYEMIDRGRLAFLSDTGNAQSFDIRTADHPHRRHQRCRQRHG